MLDSAKELLRRQGAGEVSAVEIAQAATEGGLAQADGLCGPTERARLVDGEKEAQAVPVQMIHI